MAFPGFFRNAWFYIAAGVLLTVVSALMDNFLVAQNYNKIDVLRQEQEQISQEIETLWNNSRNYEEMERQVITQIMLSDIYVEMKEALHPSKAYLREAIGELLRLHSHVVSKDEDKRQLIESILRGEESAIAKLHKNVAHHKAQSIDKINLLYGDKLEMAENEQWLRERNDKLDNVALMFQLLGLILVLAGTRMPQTPEPGIV